jgi:uncharacterized protein (DUF488 family)
MSKKPIYTIGHGSRRAAELLELLNTYGIQYLVDVRSQPYSRYHPQFSRNNLQHFVEENGIKYVFMGDTLGGRPTDPDCYRNGKVDYDILKTKDFFKHGIERLKTAYSQDLPIAIMCSERNPAECHRTRLIGQVLTADNILVQHITEKGTLKDQTTVMNEIPPSSLFD